MSDCPRTSVVLRITMPQKSIRPKIGAIAAEPREQKHARGFVQLQFPTKRGHAQFLAPHNEQPLRSRSVEAAIFRRILSTAFTRLFRWMRRRVAMGFLTPRFFMSRRMIPGSKESSVQPRRLRIVILSAASRGIASRMLNAMDSHRDRSWRGKT